MPPPPRQKNSVRKKWIVLLLLVGAIAIVAIFIVARTNSNRAHLSATAVTSPQIRSEPSDKIVFAQYAGSANCKTCHESEFEIWQLSHHGLAERLIDPRLDAVAFSHQPPILHGSQTSRVLTTNGQFEIITLGLNNQLAPFIPQRVIGVDPLRQFLIPAAGGRFQVTELAFDPIHTNWFDVYGQEDRHPGEWGHWTGRGMTWNSMCAACHNTRLRKHYQEASDTYETTMAEMSVGCEACHGPMADHNRWQIEHGAKSRGSNTAVTSGSARQNELGRHQFSLSASEGEKAGVRGSSSHLNSGGQMADPTLHPFTRDQILHTCGSCHSRRAELTGDFVPGDNLFDHYALTVPDDTDLFYPDGQIRDEDYELTAFMGSRMHAAGVRCIDCHEPHSAKVRIPGNALCMVCHASGKSVSPAPSQASAKFGPAPIIDPATHSHHKPGGAGDSCIACHMPVTHYMQRHGRHDHGFTIPDPLLTKQDAIPNACGRCHTEHDVDWALAAVDKWYGTKMNRPTRTRARILADAKSGKATSPNELLGLLHSETNSFWRGVEIGFLRRWVSDTNVVAGFVTAAKDADPLVRTISIRALDSMADRPPTAEQALQSALADPVRSVRVDAAWVLRRSVDTNSPAGSDLVAYLRHSGDQPSGAMQLGIFELDRNNLSAATALLRKAVSWDTNSAPPRHALAVALSLEGKPEEAVEQLQAACRIAPRDAELRFKLGLALNEAGQPEAALNALEQAVKIDPQYAQAWYNLGLARNAAGQEEAALDALLRAEALDPDAPQIPYARATILARLGRTDEARKAVNRALELRPDYTDARNLLDSLER